MKRSVPALTALIVSLFFIVPLVYAAKLSDGTWAQSASPGTTTITFTTATDMASGDKVVLTFPATATVNSGGTNVAITGSSSPTRANSSNVVTLTTDALIAATTPVTITMTDGLSAYTTATYAQESVSIQATDTTDSNAVLDYGIGLMTNDNSTDITADVTLFVNMAIDTTTISLGTMTTAAVAEADQTYTINTNNSGGITVSIDADAVLDSGANTIDDVSDGTVTAGAEEYGISVDNVSGVSVSSPYDSGDDPVPTAIDEIATSSAALSAATFDINYKAGIAGTTAEGNYAQVVTVTVATN
jgi:hypothetical protein